MSKFFKSTSRGFTLVELLVVIAIIGTLATLLLLQLGVARAKARDTKRIADVNQIRSALELYFDDNGGRYPDDILIADIGTYLSVPTVPVDPLTGVVYNYARDPAGAGASIRFHIWAEMENSGNWTSGDADINSTGWAGDPINGATEACTTAANDCVFDVGQN